MKKPSPYMHGLRDLGQSFLTGHISWASHSFAGACFPFFTPESPGMMLYLPDLNL